MTPLKERKLRSDKDKIPAQYVEWTKTIWMVKLRPPKENGVIATDQAIQYALKSGIIPPGAASIPVSTYNRYARILQLNRSGGRWARFQAKYGNLVHQIDASSSAYLYIARIENGEPILKLHRKAANYKNKPVPTRQRPIIYGLVDDYSGALYAQYYSAEGESAADGLDFLNNTWAKPGMAHAAPGSAWRLHGLPKLLYMDNGPLSKAGPVNELLNRLDVKKINSRPYEAKGKGKIERPWRTMWRRFELTFFMVDDWQSFEITMTELNRQFQQNYLTEYNNRPHRYNKDISRIDAWWQSVNERGGVIDIPADTLSTVFRREQRVVRGGYFNYLNNEYEVKGLDEGTVWVYEGIFNDRLIVEDVKTHRKHNVTLFEPLSFGQKFEIVKSEAEKIAEESQDKIHITEPYYMTAAGPPRKIARLPVRSTKKEVEDPFKVSPINQELHDTGGSQAIPLFGTPGERYEYLLKRDLQGGLLSETDKSFMAEFEQTPLYAQLEPIFRKWKNYYQSKAVALGE
jgi:hypothetical protein